MLLLEKLVKILKNKKITLSVAESCTGGFVSYLLTKIPGSSKIFKGAFVTYSLESKNKFFKIPLSSLKRTEGVSEKICLLLAKKIRKKFNTDIGTAVVGFAGPKAKKGIKVGTVYISLTYRNSGCVKKVIIKGSRDKIRKTASKLLIKLIYDTAKTIKP